MDELLTPISTTYLKPRQETESFLTEVKTTKPVKTVERRNGISSADDALDCLRNQPDYDTLISGLQFLNRDEPAQRGFRFQAPNPKSASIVQVLVSDIVPNYWTLLQEGSVEDVGQDDVAQPPRDVRLLLQCLQSITGINAIIAQIRALLQETRLSGKELKRADISLNLSVLLDLLANLLKGENTLRGIWLSSTTSLPNDAIKRVQSQKLASALTNGQIVSIVAEAITISGQDKIAPGIQWMAEGKEFSRWIARNVVSWARLLPHDEELIFCSDLFQRTMSLGYSETFVTIVIDELLLSKGTEPLIFSNIAFRRAQNIKKTIHILLNHLATKFLNHLSLGDSKPNEVVSAAASAIHAAIGDDEMRRTHLMSWCTSASGAGVGDNVGIRRAVLAVLAQDKEAITTVLEKSLAQFGDELYIKHAAMLQQDVHAEILLLSAGYVHRLSPIKLTVLLRMGSYMSTISKRIASTQVRARILGIIVGEALSALVDKEDKRLNFHMEEAGTEEAQWMKHLTMTSDQLGPVQPIVSDKHEIAARADGSVRSTPRATPKKKTPKPTITTEKPKPIIEEIDSSDEDDDFVPYDKTSDPEDSDDDATLVQRIKIKPPVYIRDLITYLRDTESYDKQKLAIQTAPVLIRRKANFGAEVSSHANELAGLLVGLQDKFEIENFETLRFQSMVALIVAQPKVMAPWFARTFFEGDYSLSQRTSVLISLSLSSRELAGFETSEHQTAASFPSKRLPDKMAQLYLDPAAEEQSKALNSSNLKALPATALESIMQGLTSSFLAPLAVEVADATSGPDVLKLQSFTARYKTKSQARPRKRAIPNTTAALLANSFFSPLTAHFQVALRSSRPVVLNPGLLSLYLQTLGVIIHAAGPSTLSLPQLTSELWDLLLSVRVHVLDDLPSLKGWLVAMASLLEVNNGDMRRLCETQGKEVVETREWASGVFQKTRGEDGGEENEVKMLAAGVLIKLGEAIEKFQVLMMGDLVGFS